MEMIQRCPQRNTQVTCVPIKILIDYEQAQLSLILATKSLLTQTV